MCVLFRGSPPSTDYPHSTLLTLVIGAICMNGTEQGPLAVTWDKVICFALHRRRQGGRGVRTTHLWKKIFEIPLTRVFLKIDRENLEFWTKRPPLCKSWLRLCLVPFRKIQIRCRNLYFAERNKSIDSLSNLWKGATATLTPVHVSSQLFNYRNYSIIHGAVHTHAPKP
jgi:hypothetical protein